MVQNRLCHHDKRGAPPGASNAQEQVLLTRTRRESKAKNKNDEKHKFSLRAHSGKPKITKTTKNTKDKKTLILQMGLRANGNLNFLLTRCLRVNLLLGLGRGGGGGDGGDGCGDGKCPPVVKV